MDKKALLDILNKIKLEDIKRIYVGRDHYCRCGCGGKYYEPENKIFKSMLKRAIKKANDPNSMIEYDLSYIDISYDDGTKYGKAYTIYLKKED